MWVLISHIDGTAVNEFNMQSGRSSTLPCAGREKKYWGYTDLYLDV